VYEESIGTKMNDLDFCIEIVEGHVNHCVTFATNISKPLEIEAWYQDHQ